jgi:hypothetical protein
MLVGGQGFRDAVFAHQDEADGIAKRIVFIQTIAQQGHGLLMQGLIHSYHSDPRHKYQIGQETQDFSSVQAAPVTQSDQFSQHVTLRQTGRRSCVKTSGFRVLRLVAVQHTK